MTLTLPLYGEKLVSDYLREVDEVAAIVGRRVVGKTPDSTTEPWVRVTQLAHRNTGATTEFEHLQTPMLQFDCYAGDAGGQPEANLLARTVRAALIEMRRADLDGVTVSRVQMVGHARVPDTTVDEPARERFVLTAQITMHP